MGHNLVFCKENTLDTNWRGDCGQRRKLTGSSANCNGSSGSEGKGPDPGCIEEVELSDFANGLDENMQERNKE